MVSKQFLGKNNGGRKRGEFGDCGKGESADFSSSFANITMAAFENARIYGDQVIKQLWQSR